MFCAMWDLADFIRAITSSEEYNSDISLANERPAVTVSQQPPIRQVSNFGCVNGILLVDAKTAAHKTVHDNSFPFPRSTGSFQL
jgi:hypothetical protein